MTCWVKRLCIWNVFSWNTQYRRAIYRNIPHVLVPARSSLPERRHGSIRLPGHAFLARRSSWRMIVYIYYSSWKFHQQAAGQLLPLAAGNVRKRQAVLPVYHVQKHTCRVNLPQTASRADVLGQPSSLQPHWSLPTIVNWLGCCPNKVTGGGRGWMRNQKYIYLHGTYHNRKNIISNI
jgi:hypothetical protein